MKTEAIVLAAFISCISGLAETSPRQEMMIGTNRIELIWNAPLSNHYPSMLWVYRIVPQSFSPAVISNLMALGSFTMADRTHVEGQPSFKDKQMMYFTDENKRKELGVFPSIGWIYYNDRDAEPKKNEVSTVPNDEKAYELALEFLRKFGVDRSQLVTKPGSTELKIMRDVEIRGYFNDEKKKEIEDVVNRGVFFIRRVDGIDFDGIGSRGGVYFNFGKDCRLARLKIVWKGIEPFQLHKTLTPQEIMAGIVVGKTQWENGPMAWQSAKTITITSCVPYYRGLLGDDKEHKFIEPYAELSALVDDGVRKIVLKVECPTLGELLEMENE